MLLCENNYDLDGNSTQNSKETIAKIEKLYNNKKQLLEDLKYEVEIINKERFNIYKSNVYYSISCLCKDVQLWHFAIKNGTINGEKLDKRKKYKEKDNYDYVKTWIEETIGHSIKIYDIISLGFNTEAWCIYFTSESYKWVIEIPVVNNITMKSFDYYGGYYFKIRLGDCNADHCTKIIDSTFNEEILKDIFDKWLENIKNNK